MTIFWFFIIFSALSFLSTLVGVLLILGAAAWARHWLIYFVSFAAGILLSVALLDLLPQAVAAPFGGNVFLALVIGISTFFFIEKTLIWYHCHDKEECHIHTYGVMSVVGTYLHNFFDGVVVAATFLANPSLGLATALAVTAHEIPHEASDFSIWLHSGMNKKTAIFLSFISAIVAIIGALFTFIFANYLKHYLGIALAICSGGLLYISMADLIPELHKDTGGKIKSLAQIVCFAIGVWLGYLLARFNI